MGGRCREIRRADVQSPVSLPHTQTLQSAVSLSLTHTRTRTRSISLRHPRPSLPQLRGRLHRCALRSARLPRCGARWTRGLALPHRRSPPCPLGHLHLFVCRRGLPYERAVARPIVIANVIAIAISMSASFAAPDEGTPFDAKGKRQPPRMRLCRMARQVESGHATSRTTALPASSCAWGTLVLTCDACTLRALPRAKRPLRCQ